MQQKITPVAVEVDHKNLNNLIHHYHEVGDKPIMTWGTTGIGKSVEVENTSKEIAEKIDTEKTIVNYHNLDEERKEEILDNLDEYFVYIQWNEVSKELKETIMDNPDSFYVFKDVRLSEYEPADIKGVPDLDGDSVDWQPPKWVKHMSNEDARGTLFLDEVNLAPTSVQNAAYQLVLDKQVGSHSISDNIHIVAAGNRSQDKAKVYDMPAPLRDRFRHVELEIPTAGQVQRNDNGKLISGSWTNYAIENNLNELVIGYIASPHGDNDLFNFYDNQDSKAFTTPRTWESIADSLENLDPSNPQDEQLIYNVVASHAGEGVAERFRAFLQVRQNLDLNELLDNPEEAAKLREYSEDEKYSIVTALASRYSNDKSIAENLVKLAANMENEYGILLLRISKQYRKDHLVDHLVESDEWDSLHDEYADYLID